MGRIFKRSQNGNYYGDWQDAQGTRHRESLKTKDREVAKARLRAKERSTTDIASNQGEALSKAISRLLTVHIPNPRTNKSYTQKARHLTRLLGNGDVNNLTVDALGNYVATRREEGASDSTIYKELVVLRGALTHSTKAGMFRLPISIVPQVRVNYRPKTRWLTPAELDKLVAALPTAEQKLWVVLCCFTGATSPSEVQRISRADIDFAGGWIRIRGTKRESRWRRVPLAAEIRPWLTDAQLPLSWPNYLQALERACKRAGIDKVTGNDLRRTYCSWLKQAGVDSLTASHLMGHASTAMVEKVYGQLSEQTYKDAVAKLPTLPRKLRLM